MKIVYVFLIALIAFFIPKVSFASSIVNNISVIGNQSVSKDFIIDKSAIKKGHFLSNEDIDEAIKLLMSTGQFANVSIKANNGQIVIKVQEYARINQILFKGTKKLRDSDLSHVAGLKPRESIDSMRLKMAAKSIGDAYNSVGLLNTKVNAYTQDVGGGRVNVIFEIQEGSAARVAKISFVGNYHYSSRLLRDLISTKQTNIFSWLTQSDVYNEGRIEADKELLSHYYSTKGYADFRVLSVNATLDPKLKGYNVVFVVDEGRRYRFGSMQVESSIPGINIARLQKVIVSRTGDIYNERKVQESTIALNDVLADAGYAFAKIDTHSDRDFVHNTLSLVYNITQGPRVYIEKIEIKGNNKTRDYVIRRELDLSEGDAFNQTKLQRAKRRLDALGIYQGLSISTMPGSAEDKIILVIDVAETPTGEFSIGGGYTTGGETPGFSLDVSIAERNFLGRGQYVRLGGSFGKNNAKDLMFTFTEPYFLGRRISTGFDVFRTTYRMNDQYDVGQSGISGRLSFPLSEDFNANLSYNYISENFALGASDGYAEAIVEAAAKKRLRSSLQYSLVYNTLDNFLIPHEGIYARAGQEFAGIGGDAHFLKSTLKATYYKTLSEQLDAVALISFYGGVIHPTRPNGAQIFDMFKNSQDSLRGFNYNGIGPRQKGKNGSYYFLGGKKMLDATVELQFPFPLLPESLGVRGAIFADTGTVYDSSYKPSKSDNNPILGDDMFWRASTGVSLMWSSPLGPLRFDYAIPLRKREGDLIQNFNFGVSQTF